MKLLFFFFDLAAVGDESSKVKGLNINAGGDAPADKCREFNACLMFSCVLGNKFCPAMDI